MPIHGLQKVTLLDYPDRIACSVFFAGCNFRCPFCHNASLVTRIDPENAISQEELLTYLKKRSGVLDGVCITGGEPLLDPGLEEFLHSIKSLGYSVKLDTNGSNPSRMRKLVSDGSLIMWQWISKILLPGTEYRSGLITMTQKTLRQAQTISCPALWNMNSGQL